MKIKRGHYKDLSEVCPGQSAFKSATYPLASREEERKQDEGSANEGNRR